MCTLILIYVRNKPECVGKCSLLICDIMDMVYYFTQGLRHKLPPSALFYFLQHSVCNTYFLFFSLHGILLLLVLSSKQYFVNLHCPFILRLFLPNLSNLLWAVVPLLYFFYLCSSVLCPLPLSSNWLELLWASGKVFAFVIYLVILYWIST